MKEVINCGGIAEKNSFIMQTYADVTGRPMKVRRSSQTCVLRACIFGAIVVGVYNTAQDQQLKMTGVKDTVYNPIPENVEVYQKLHSLYVQLHDGFGAQNSLINIGNIMKDLIQIRKSVISE